jgi:acetyl esterase
VRDLKVGRSSLMARLYRPALEPRPLIVFLHGGMWVMGDLDTHDRTCRRFSLAADAAILAVDYRRGPEEPWPAAVDDAVSAVAWARSEAVALGGDPERVSVAGDSSGGHLAVLACLRMRREPDRAPNAMLLACPNIDPTLSEPSVAAQGSGWGLEARDLAWAVRQWAPAEVGLDDPGVNPLREPDLRDLPPTLLVTAEHDPLRDEGDAFAAALSRAGNEVRHRCEPGLVHGFIQGLDLISPSAAAAADRFFADARELVRAGAR